MPAQQYRHGAVYARSLAEYLLDQGYDRGRVFAGTAFGADLLAQDKPFAEFPDIAEFFEHAARLTGNDLLGFEQGIRRDMRRTGLLSYVGLSSPTVRDFIKNFARYRRVFTDVVELDETRLEQSGVLSWYFRVPARVDRRQLVEFGATGILSGLEKAACQKLRLRRVCFRHLRKTHIDVIERYLGCRVEFGARNNAFFFEPATLDLPLATADHELYAILRQYAEEVLERDRANGSPLIVDVERAITARLAAGEARQDVVARDLGLSSRTLARRLAQEDTTYFRTLSDLRQSLAVSYLRNSDLGLGEIAYLLGYSNLSSFADAFKRWVGMSPGRFRATADR
ncbi:AraC family transcriptional regulator ligand-binding domain-containing protein [Microbulbifer sp. S227A]|uniref:AraC family transcriptional regulator n=1 Tax=Microbulbifer sp. S227A TaxID=3415131 RepID=UPI003C7CD6B4